MPRSIAVLVNPSSRRGRAAVAARRLLAELRSAGAHTTVLVGRSAADSARLAREAAEKRPDALVAVGGDGLVNTALQGVVGTGVPLGVLPAGTGNDIAREFGIGSSPAEAARRALRGYAVEVDAVSCAGGERGPGFHYLSVLACGFDARVNERVNGFGLSLGSASYLAGIAAELRSFRPVPFRLEADGHVVEAEGMLAAVGNTRSYGGGVRVCPGARSDDGLLEAVFVHAVGVGDFLRFFPRALSGSHVELDEVEVLTGRRVVVEAEPGADGRPVSGYADGERVGALPLVCEAVPGAVRLLQ
ncbi:diacylglycerol/lipid kinase family protein [Nocardiopsis chromatogenes]|uniref:diacylglycerol/lipid kinase family protein n=1 Tax=Nocardiopsis chromatogenes TaxID=280239 RepID=UPI000373471F|nr:diacylglycerol kinase family protein [Nocardiopsis chromatogenes]